MENIGTLGCAQRNSISPALALLLGAHKSLAAQTNVTKNLISAGTSDMTGCWTGGLPPQSALTRTFSLYRLPSATVFHIHDVSAVGFSTDCPLP
jgi:hypothetical protein